MGKGVHEVKIGEKPAGHLKTRDREMACEAARELIRAMSRSGRLTSRDHIFQAIPDHCHTTEAEAGGPDHMEILIRDAMQGHQDICEVVNRRGVSLYYSSLHMTQAYVALLLRKDGNLLDLIADTVRENSALYPRPIPLNTFLLPPFDMTDQEALVCISRTALLPEYQDIKQTITSAGTRYLFSSRHLEPGHAIMLAEWLDVGQFNNP
jgi:hypothetical protein